MNITIMLAQVVLIKLTQSTLYVEDKQHNDFTFLYCDMMTRISLFKHYHIVNNKRFPCDVNSQYLLSCQLSDTLDTL